jgi:hypothetical protein
MTVEAQQSMIFGAMCIDEEFRNELKAPPVAPETQEERIGRVVREYAASNDAFVHDSVVQNVKNVLLGPCREATLHACEAAQAAACPCWPC